MGCGASSTVYATPPSHHHQQQQQTPAATTVTQKEDVAAIKKNLKESSKGGALGMELVSILTDREREQAAQLRCLRTSDTSLGRGASHFNDNPPHTRFGNVRADFKGGVFVSALLMDSANTPRSLCYVPPSSSREEEENLPKSPAATTTTTDIGPQGSSSSHPLPTVLALPNLPSISFDESRSPRISIQTKAMASCTSGTLNDTTILAIMATNDRFDSSITMVGDCTTAESLIHLYNCSDAPQPLQPQPGAEGGETDKLKEDYTAATSSSSSSGRNDLTHTATLTMSERLDDEADENVQVQQQVE